MLDCAVYFLLCAQCLLCFHILVAGVETDGVKSTDEILKAAGLISADWECLLQIFCRLSAAEIGANVRIYQ